MSAATMIRIVPAADVPRALAILNGGNALATTIAAPLGSFLGQYIGWRGAFFCVVPIAALTLLWQFVTLPRMPSHERASAAAAFKVLRRPGVPYGMLAAALLFLGQFALFTYLRPFFEMVTRVDVTTISALLLVMGVAGLVGTTLIGLVIRDRLYTFLVLMPFAMAVIAVALTALGRSLGATTALMFLWGFIGTAAPVGWFTWLSEALPDDAEAGGGLMVAVIQLAITAGAAGGGVLFDSSGYRATFLFSAVILVARDLGRSASPQGQSRRGMRFLCVGRSGCVTQRLRRSFTAGCNGSPVAWMEKVTDEQCGDRAAKGEHQ